MRISLSTRRKLIGTTIGLLLTCFIISQIPFYIAAWKTERFHITQRRIVIFKMAIDFYFWDHDQQWPPLAIPDLQRTLSAPEFDEWRESKFGTDILGRIRPCSAVDGFGNDLKFTLLPDGHVRVASAGPNGIHENGGGDDISQITYCPRDEADPE